MSGVKLVKSVEGWHRVICRYVEAKYLQVMASTREYMYLCMYLNTYIDASGIHTPYVHGAGPRVWGPCFTLKIIGATPTRGRYVRGVGVPSSGLLRKKTNPA